MWYTPFNEVPQSLEDVTLNKTKDTSLKGVYITSKRKYTSLKGVYHIKGVYIWNGTLNIGV
jgi:hypothetical protein